MILGIPAPASCQKCQFWPNCKKKKTEIARTGCCKANTKSESERAGLLPSVVGLEWTDLRAAITMPSGYVAAAATFPLSDTAGAAIWGSIDFSAARLSQRC